MKISPVFHIQWVNNEDSVETDAQLSDGLCISLHILIPLIHY